VLSSLSFKNTYSRVLYVFHTFNINQKENTPLDLYQAVHGMHFLALGFVEMLLSNNLSWRSKGVEQKRKTE